MKFHARPGQSSARNTAKNSFNLWTNINFQSILFKVKELLVSSESLLSDTGSFEKFQKYCLGLIEEIKIYVKDNYENWVKDTTDNIDNEALWWVFNPFFGFDYTF